MSNNMAATSKDYFGMAASETGEYCSLLIPLMIEDEAVEARPELRVSRRVNTVPWMENVRVHSNRAESVN